MLFRELHDKIKFWANTDRIGPDILGTYWKIFFKNTMLKPCTKKFHSFPNSSDSRLGAYVVGCSEISIRHRVVIRPATMLHVETKTLKSSIIIEDDVMLESRIHLYIENHCFHNHNMPIINQDYYNAKQVILKKGCWIGANAIILPGVTIGENSVVGAGTIVTKSVPDRVVVIGNPAKVIKLIKAIEHSDTYE
ncbi:MAG: acyltransferase [Pedobacter sp.]|jgi:serine acetyltransferase|uniref:acyltransferase n=1 Tax=Pedobacter sp. TaxID=1411316 RepID=UPI003562BA03